MAQRTADQNGQLAESDRHRFQYTLRMLVMYFVLAFALTWAVLIPALSAVPEDGLTPYFILAAFGPMVSAVVTIWTRRGLAALRQWLRSVFTLRIPVLLYLTGAFFLPIGVGVLHYGLYKILGGEPDFRSAIPWYQYLAYLIPTALLTGGNEEPGWRAFALPALLERFHAVSTAVILGVIHSAWHLPLMSHYDTTFGRYLFNVIPLTFIFNWLYLRSRKSVIPVMLFHAGTNVIGNFVPTPMDVLGGVGTYMVLRGFVYWGIAITLTVVTKGRLGWDPVDDNLAA
jgi:membrane protease YdiL (CAAX protease family)